MNTSKKWMEKARLWRFILLARQPGKRYDARAGMHWDATPGLALALQASFAPAPAAAARRSCFHAVAAAAGGGDVDLDDADGATAVPVGAEPAAAEPAAAEPAATRIHGDAAAGDAAPDAPPDAPPDDCPLVFSHLAIEATLPRCLKALPAEALPLRCWTTALVAASARTLTFGWLVDDGDTFGAGQVTLVDAAEAWLAAQPQLAACLPALTAAAEAQVARWHASQEQRITRTRHAEIALPTRRAQLAVRSAGEVSLALLTKHEMFATLGSPGLDWIRRWQKVMILVTCALALLVADVWFAYSHALNCCKDVRALLGCSASPYDDCTVDGAVYAGGACAKLTTGAAASGGLSAEYVCAAFPDPSNDRDQVVVALIAIACSLPISIFLEYCFETSNEFEVDDKWLTWSLPRTLVMLGRTQWRYARERPGYVRRAVAQYANKLDKLIVEIMIVDALRWPFVTAARLMRGGAATAAAAEEAAAPRRAALQQDDTRGDALQQAAEAPAEGADVALERASGSTTAESIDEAAEETVANARCGRRIGALGLAAVYACWAVFTWILFAYGSLMVHMVSDDAANDYLRTWGIAYAIDQGKEWKGVVKAALVAVAALYVLDYFVIIRNDAWFEEHIDTLSVHATLFTGVRTTWWQRVVCHLRFHSRVAKS